MIQSIIEIQAEIAKVEQQISERQKTALSQDDLNELKDLRQVKVDLEDKLLLTKNLEALAEKDAEKKEIKALEKECQRDYKKMGELAREALPILQELQPTMQSINDGVAGVINGNSRLQSLNGSFYQNYGEYIEVKGQAVELGLVSNYVTLLHPLISKLERMSKYGQPKVKTKNEKIAMA